MMSATAGYIQLYRILNQLEPLGGDNTNFKMEKGEKHEEQKSV